MELRTSPLKQVYNLADVDNPDTLADESLDGKLRLKDFSTAGFKKIWFATFAYGGNAKLPIDRPVIDVLASRIPAGRRQGDVDSTFH